MNGPKVDALLVEIAEAVADLAAARKAEKAALGRLVSVETSVWVYNDDSKGRHSELIEQRNRAVGALDVDALWAMLDAAEDAGNTQELYMVARMLTMMDDHVSHQAARIVRKAKALARRARVSQAEALGQAGKDEASMVLEQARAATDEATALLSKLLKQLDKSARQ